MKILVFGGSGAIGCAIAWDLAKEEKVKSIGIVGRRKDALMDIKEWIGSEKVTTHSLDILNRRETQRLMRQYDVGIVTLPDRKTSYSLIHSAVEVGFNLVDNLEEYHRRPDVYETEGLQLPEGMTLNDYGDWLHDTAVKNNATVVDGMGFAPGLSNITVAEAMRKLDRIDTAVARVGGIPSKEAAKNHPLRYMITWAFEHVLREYMVKLNVIKDGRVVEVDALTDRERFKFDKFGQDEYLECAITPGMPSFVFTRPGLKYFAEKTVRWPGHWEGIDTLKEVGLLDIAPVDFQGTRISPREFMLALIKPKLMPLPDETDVCVMWNTVTGELNGRRKRIDYYMWDEADKENGISSMARTTGFTEAICARFLAEGKIEEKGVVAPEDAVSPGLYSEYIAELHKRNIHILEEIRDLD